MGTSFQHQQVEWMHQVPEQGQRSYGLLWWYKFLNICKPSSFPTCLLTCTWSSREWCCAGEETGSPTAGTGSRSIWCWPCHGNPHPDPECTLTSQLLPPCCSRRFHLQSQRRSAVSFSQLSLAQDVRFELYIAVQIVVIGVLWWNSQSDVFYRINFTFTTSMKLK